MIELVSAIIITHNRLVLLRRAIDSVLSQTYKNIECIVVDDNSDDGTQEYCSYNPNIRYIRIDKADSRGGNYARNVGIRAAKGKYVAFLDDDDMWMPEKTALQVKVAEEEGGPCLVYCWKRTEIVTNNGIFYKDGSSNPTFVGCMRDKILMTINCCTSSMIFMEKAAAEQIGMFDEQLAMWQDYEFTVRAAQVMPFRVVPQPLIIYRNDLTDSKRLTNRIDKWERSVKRIYSNNRDAYMCLTTTENAFRRKIWYRDRLKRCRKNGRKFEYFFYRLYFLWLSILLFPAKIHGVGELFFPADLLSCARKNG